MAINRSRCRKAYPEPGRRGFVAVTALLIMAVLLMVGMAFLSMATTENTMVVNEINSQVAFNIAEAGIDHAKRALIGANLTTVIQNNQTTPFLNLVSFASGTYTVNVTNNCNAVDNRCTNLAVAAASLDTGGPTSDTDSRVVVESTGTYRNSTKKVRTLIEIPAILNPPASIYTLNGPDGRDPTDFEFKDNSFLVQGADTAPGQTTPIAGGAEVPGLGVMACATCDHDHTPLEEATDALGGPQDDNITGAGGDPSIAVVTTSITASYLATFKSYLIANANVTYNGNTTIDSGALGTQASPQITVVNGDFKLRSGASGYGILLVTGKFEMEGNTTFQGIILVDGNDGKVELKGNSMIWGALIQINRDPGSNSGETRLKIEGNAQVFYSSQAIEDNAGSTLSPTTLAWSERSPS